MKAFLLAAGTGSRLRPLTDRIPKCLLRFGGRSLLDLWLDELARVGTDEVLVNLHHLPEPVRRHIGARDGPPLVRTVFEPVLLGSAGTLVANRSWVAGEELMLVCNADNLTDFDLSKLIDFHLRGDVVASLTVFRADNPSACGVVQVDRTHRIVGYAEKPDHPVGNLANAGICAFHPSVIDQIEGTSPLDIGYDLLPKLVGMARAIEVDGYFRDIGTPAVYEQAQRTWRARRRETVR